MKREAHHYLSPLTWEKRIFTFCYNNNVSTYLLLVITIILQSNLNYYFVFTDFKVDEFYKFVHH